MVDSFQDSWEGAGHGNVGTYAAKQHGFRGQVYAENIGPDVQKYPRSFMAQDYLNLGPQDPADTRQAVRDIARFRAADLLSDVGGDLDKLRQKGLHDSAVNVSYGVTPVRVANDVMQSVYSGTFPNSPNQNMTQNVLKAYQIDPARLGSQDPKVSGPELKRLQESILQDTRAGLAHPEVKQAQATYDKAVADLQAQHNSVVVSAGNDQETPKFWGKNAQGNKVKLEAGDFHNPLANSDVTTVGATRWVREVEGLKERVAEYSNQDPAVDVYASGAVGNGQDVNRMKVDGTSYASPRWAGATATVRGNHPGISESQLRTLMNNRLTHELPGAGAPVLDFQAAEEYMRKGTF